MGERTRQQLCLSPARERRRRELTGVGFLENPCVPSLVLVISPSRPPLLPLQVERGLWGCSQG